MAIGEQEYIMELGKSISERALGSNWTDCVLQQGEHVGQLEEVISDVRLLQNTVGLLCAVIVNKKILSIEQLKDLMENGWRIGGEK